VIRSGLPKDWVYPLQELLTEQMAQSSGVWNPLKERRIKVIGQKGGGFVVNAIVYP
jgi:hypothetical protein